MAPSLLITKRLLAFGIISLMMASAARGLESAPVDGVGVAILALIEALAAFRLLRARHELA